MCACIYIYVYIPYIYIRKSLLILRKNHRYIKSMIKRYTYNQDIFIHMYSD